MNRFYVVMVMVAVCAQSSLAVAQEKPASVGRTTDISREKESDKWPLSARNDVAQQSDPIVTKRYFRIKKGTFPEFLEASREGVWPYFEKIGARVIGMWQIIDPEAEDLDNGKDYDEVVLMTQYASYEHWKATRQAGKLGGKGPDWERFVEAIKLRRSLTLEDSVEVLRGLTWHNPPHYMPAIEDQPENAAPNKAVNPSGESGGK